MQRSLYFVVVIALFGLSDGWLWGRGGHGLGVQIIYTVENTLTNHPSTFSASQRLVQGEKPMVDFMKFAARRDPRFKYKSEDYGELGLFITEINGLAGNHAEETFWAFITRDPTVGDCLHNVGVSSYYPSPEEHVVMSFKTYDVFDELPNCETGATEDIN